MTQREFLKYNNPDAFDMQGKPIKPGDTVVINNHYGASPTIGIVDHFTQCGQLAVCYNWVSHYGGKTHTVKCWAYRPSKQVVKLKNGNKNNSKHRS